MDSSNDFTLSCPLPIQQYPQVLLAHGGGGKLMHQLIERMFVPAFSNPLLGARHDGAVISLDTLNGSRMAFTTDSYVVRPLFFPGGDIGRHGIAIMAAREGLSFESEITSDCAPLAGLVGALIEAGIEVHCLRDLTRGGLASALVEIAEAARVKISIDEIAIPVREDVRGACEILGFDPLYLANEGRFVAFVASPDAERALSIMNSLPSGNGASIVGEVADVPSAIVTLKSRIGATRIVDMFTGEQLPRIC